MTSRQAPRSAIAALYARLMERGITLEELVNALKFGNTEELEQLKEIADRVYHTGGDERRVVYLIVPDRHAGGLVARTDDPLSSFGLYWTLYIMRYYSSVLAQEDVQRRAQRIYDMLEAALEYCGLDAGPIESARVKSYAERLASFGASPEVLIDADIFSTVDCASRDKFFESLERVARLFAPGITSYAAVIEAQLKKALEEWKSGERSPGAAEVIRDLLLTLAELGFRPQAYVYYKTARELGVPLTLSVEVSDSVTRVARELKALISLAESAASAALLEEYADAARRARELTAETLAAMMSECIGRCIIEQINAVRERIGRDKIVDMELGWTLSVTICTDPSDFETEGVVLAALAPFTLAYPHDRVEWGVRWRFVRYEFRISERAAALAKELLRHALGAAAEDVERWLEKPGVCSELARSPTPETLRRLLSSHPLAGASTSA